MKPSAQRAFRPMLRSNGQKNEPFGDGQNGNKTNFIYCCMCMENLNIFVRFVLLPIRAKRHHYGMPSAFSSRFQIQSFTRNSQEPYYHVLSSILWRRIKKNPCISTFDRRQKCLNKIYRTHVNLLNPNLLLIYWVTRKFLCLYVKTKTEIHTLAFVSSLSANCRAHLHLLESWLSDS